MTRCAEPPRLVLSTELDRIDDPEARFRIETEALRDAHYGARLGGATIGIGVITLVCLLVVPYMAPAWLVLGAMAMARAERRLSEPIVRAAMWRHGYLTCGRCGYDCRGIDATRCPECGLPTPGPPAPGE